jgi:hypothetical protein
VTICIRHFTEIIISQLGSIENLQVCFKNIDYFLLQCLGQLKASEFFNTKQFFSNQPAPIPKTSHPLHRWSTREKRELIKHVTTPKHCTSDKNIVEAFDGWTFFSSDDCDTGCQSFDFKSRYFVIDNYLLDKFLSTHVFYIIIG